MKVFLAAALLVCCALGLTRTQAEAALLTFTATGTINDGFDNGVFGAPVDLAGQDYTVTLTFDLDALSSQTVNPNLESETISNFESSEISITLGGVTKSFLLRSDGFFENSIVIYNGINPDAQNPELRFDRMGLGGLGSISSGSNSARLVLGFSQSITSFDENLVVDPDPSRLLDFNVRPFQSFSGTFV